MALTLGRSAESALARSIRVASVNDRNDLDHEDLIDDAIDHAVLAPAR
jgi:hypothetical protein